MKRRITVEVLIPYLKSGAIAVVIGVAITLGSLFVPHFVDDPLPPPGTTFRGMPFPYVKIRPMIPRGEHVSFKLLREHGTWMPAGAIVDVAFWSGCIAVILAIRSAGRSSRAKTLKERGYCPNCGYSLAGLLGTRCPECGGPIDPGPPWAGPA